MRVDINGRNSCTGKSRHIEIRYLFINNLVEKEDLSVFFFDTTHVRRLLHKSTTIRPVS